MPAALEYAALDGARASDRRTASTSPSRSATSVGAVEADELRFKQVVLNLLSNAVKFTPDGGSVSCRAESADDQLGVTVTDTGIGMPAEDRERIFESFQQGGRGAPREEGTGLGLTLCRRIVELFGGRMWLESEVGRGSTFGFSVPIAARGAMHRDDAGGARRRPADRGRRSRTTAPSLDLLTAYLDGAGVAGRGRARRRRGPRRGPARATRRGRPRHPAARHGRLGGARRAEGRRRRPRDIPVIVVSIVDERPRGMALGAAAYLIKPVGREELLAALAARRHARAGRADTGARGGVDDRTAHPRRRGQPEEPEARA